MARRQSRPKMPGRLRMAIYERDRYRCRKCGHAFTPPPDYRGQAPVRELVGHRDKVYFAQYSFNGGDDIILTRREPIYIALEIDHIHPLSKGGAFRDPANLQSLCSPCNHRKGANA